MREYTISLCFEVVQYWMALACSVRMVRSAESLSRCSVYGHDKAMIVYYR